MTMIKVTKKWAVNRIKEIRQDITDLDEKYAKHNKYYNDDKAIYEGKIWMLEEIIEGRRI